MLGLYKSEKTAVIKDMINNFSYLIDTFSFIPNGNRSYYLTRSQPPFFPLMVNLLSKNDSNFNSSDYLPSLEKEYEFWMKGADTLNTKSNAFKRVVLMPDGSILNRYWDDRSDARTEHYLEDLALVKGINGTQKDFKHIRAAAESGWDFSSRWFKDTRNMSTINTTDIVPIDLNALLYFHEQFLAKQYTKLKQTEKAQLFLAKAESRKNAILKYMWNSEAEFFFDYNFVDNSNNKVKSLAAMYPLLMNFATKAQAAAVALTVKEEFLQPGGVLTTLENTGQQWDSPNGWAPLQWVSIVALHNNNQAELANDIKSRWIKLNTAVFKRTGKMLEKYNVKDVSLIGGGGSYPVQDGFGWTNGVYLWLKSADDKDYQILDIK